MQKHCKKIGSSDNYRFIDLQLPLYRMLLPLDETFWREVDLKPENVSFQCGYFNIPKAVTETGYSMWQNLGSHLRQAEKTVEEVAERIRSEIRKNRIPAFKPHPKSDFLEFYRTDPLTALRGINWEEEKEEEEE